MAVPDVTMSRHAGRNRVQRSRLREGAGRRTTRLRMLLQGNTHPPEGKCSMSDLDLARNDPEALLWRELDEVHAGMLGIEGSGQHLQPMAHRSDRERRRLWFFTKRDTDLVKALQPGTKAHFAIISRAQDFHACMSGTLREEMDREAMDRLWNAHVAAWFKGGEGGS